MKRTLLMFLSVALALCAPGAAQAAGASVGQMIGQTPTASAAPVPVEGATKLTTLTDGKMTLGRCAAPSDFAVQHEIYNCDSAQSPAFPAQLFVSAVSPDGRTAMIYYSAHDYTHLLEASIGGVSYATHQDGAIDSLTLTPMLTFMNVDAYEDFLIAGLFPDLAITVHAQAEIDAQLQETMDREAQRIYDAAIARLANTPGATVDGAYYGTIERSYAFEAQGEPYLASVLTAVSAA